MNRKRKRETVVVVAKGVVANYSLRWFRERMDPLALFLDSLFPFRISGAYKSPESELFSTTAILRQWFVTESCLPVAIVDYVILAYVGGSIFEGPPKCARCWSNPDRSLQTSFTTHLQRQWDSFFCTVEPIWKCVKCDCVFETCDNVVHSRWNYVPGFIYSDTPDSKSIRTYRCDADPYAHHT